MPHPAPRVAAIHDLSALGRCSLTVILPVLSAMGAQCCPLLTAYLSAHTGFPRSDKALFLELTDQMGRVADHWGELELSFDAVYSGFLGSAGQIGQVERFLERFRRPGQLVLVDPVMGDHGKTYRTCTPELCRRMAGLAGQADCITPNFTEAALLLGEDYDARPRDEAGIRSWLTRLSLEGRRSVVLTGVSLGEGQVGGACYDRTDGSIHFAMAQRQDGAFGGTGDLFAAVLLGGLLRGASLPGAMAAAVDFTAKAVAHTLELGTPPREGVQFEPLLKELMEPAL